MDKLKELVSLILGGCLQVSGKGRTYAKAPLWLLLLLAITCPHLALITVLLYVAFGMQAKIVKA